MNSTDGNMAALAAYQRDVDAAEAKADWLEHLTAEAKDEILADPDLIAEVFGERVLEDDAVLPLLNDIAHGIEGVDGTLRRLDTFDMLTELIDKHIDAEAAARGEKQMEVLKEEAEEPDEYR